ncbi:hypothetical protein LCGC14_2279470 [marine sediment metagenome]|uniref:Outer membrane protein beta-barrel domain-containing protein n=1 Tax=marine sediment metagenome TaxID=412755 RepID=A0A0F9DGU9_9ZZZZ
MKKILIVLAVMLVVTNVVTAGEGKLHGDASLAYVPELEGLDINISLNYDLLKNWNVYGSTSVLFDFTTPELKGSPYRAAYTIGTRVKFLKYFYVELEHICTHPVYSNSEDFFYDRFEGGNRTDFKVGVIW